MKMMMNNGGDGNMYDTYVVAYHGSLLSCSVCVIEL